MAVNAQLKNQRREYCCVVFVAAAIATNAAKVAKQHDHQTLEVELGLEDMPGCVNGIKARRTYVKHGSDRSGRELRIERLRREYQESELLEIVSGRNRAQQKHRQFDEEKRDDGVLKRNAAPGQRCRRRQTLADKRRN